MPPATEIAHLPLKAGMNIHDATSSEGSIWMETVNTVLEQPGSQRAYWGTEVEDASMLRFFVDWDTVAAHKTFMKSDAYGPFSKRLGTIMDSPAVVYHATLSPSTSHGPSDTFAPVTEIMTAFFPPSISPSAKSAFEDALASRSALLTAHGSTGSAGGWAEEPQAQGVAYVAVVGWPSLAAHKAFRESKDFKEHGGLTGTHEITEISTVHVNGIEVQGSGGAGLGAEERGAAADAQEEVLNPQGGVGKVAPKTTSEGATTKHEGIGNTINKERSGRGPPGQGGERH